MRGPELGNLSTPIGVRRALRTIEVWLSKLLPDDAPSGVNPQVLVREPGGVIRQYDLISAGGCTVTFDVANQQIKISVP